MGHLIAQMQSRLWRELLKKGNRDKNSSSPLPLELCHQAVKNSPFTGLDIEGENKHVGDISLEPGQDGLVPASEVVFGF